MILTVILVGLGILCIPAMAYINFWYAKRHDDDTPISISVAFCIIFSILNWFAFAFNYVGFVVTPISGFYGGEELNLLGLFIAIAPPVIIVTLGYLLFLLVYRVRYEIVLAKERNKRKY